MIVTNKVRKISKKRAKKNHVKKATNKGRKKMRKGNKIKGLQNGVLKMGLKKISENRRWEKRAIRKRVKRATKIVCN